MTELNALIADITDFIRGRDSLDEFTLLKSALDLLKNHPDTQDADRYRGMRAAMLANKEPTDVQQAAMQPALLTRDPVLFDKVMDDFLNSLTNEA